MPLLWSWGEVVGCSYKLAAPTALEIG